MAKVSKESRRKISASLEREEEAKKAHMKLMDEQELRGLTRQAMMAKDANLVDAITEKHKTVKNILVREKDSLEYNLKRMKSKYRCITDHKQAQEISNLFAQGDDLAAAIQEEKKYIQELESQIRKDVKNIHNLKKAKGNTSGSGEFLQKKQMERAERSMESWKSKLAAEQTQLALVVKQNEDIRGKVQRLIKEKGQFNKLFGELMEKLTKGKGIMADIVERARQQFQKRDEISRKIDALRSRNKADLVKRMEEMQELEMKLFEDKRLAGFRVRIQMVREKLKGTKRPSNKDSTELQELTTRVEKANGLWDELQEATGLNTYNEICKYIMTEDSNLFTLFRLNNEVRDQVEVMTCKTAELITTVNDETALAEENLDDNSKSRDLMQKKLVNMEHMLNDFHDVFEANTRVFSRLLDKIKVLFDLINCETSTLNDLLGESTKVTEHNYRLFLGIVETKVISLLEATTLPTRSVISAHPSTLSASRQTTVPTVGSAIPLKKVLTRMCPECEKIRKF